MAERSEARFEESTTGRLNPGEHISVNIDGVARCVGLYITNACQVIWCDSDGNFDYECALSSIDIEGGSWEVFRVTMSGNMNRGDIPHLFTQMGGEREGQNYHRKQNTARITR